VSKVITSYAFAEVSEEIEEEEVDEERIRGSAAVDELILEL